MLISKDSLEINKWAGGMAVSRIVVNPQMVAGSTLGALAVDSSGIDDALESIRKNMEEKK